MLVNDPGVARAVQRSSVRPIKCHVNQGLVAGVAARVQISRTGWYLSSWPGDPA